MARLREVCTALRVGLQLRPGPAAVAALPMPSAAAAVAAQETCYAADVRVGCFRPPAVPPSGSCLRVTGRADLTPDDLEYALVILRDAFGRARDHALAPAGS